MHKPVTTNRSLTHNRGCIKPRMLHYASVGLMRATVGPTGSTGAPSLPVPGAHPAQTETAETSLTLPQTARE
jgi:hypothetical protein